MGNSASNSREGDGRYYGYGSGNVLPNHHYDPRYYGPDPYHGNPLPTPPKEPLPQGPIPGYHTPYLGPPEHIRERAPSDGSNGRKRGNSLLKSLGGLSKKIAGSSGGRNDPDNVWTYPDGKTPFPIKKAELSPHIRPARFRSNSFSGRDKNTERYLWGEAAFQRDDPQPSRWRSLNKANQRLGREPLPKPTRTDQARYLWPHTHRKDGYFFPDDDGIRARPRRSLSETRDRRPRGVSIDGYVPPERRDRSWDYPDGTPWPRLQEVSPARPTMGVGPPGITPIATAGALPRPPSLSNIHPSGGAGMNGAAAQPIASTSTVLNDLTGVAGPSTNRRNSRNSQGLQFPTNGMSHMDDPMHPLHETVPGQSNYINIDVSFSFDRRSPLALYSYHGIVYGGKLYPTAYHVFEAMKYIDTRPDLAKRIRKTGRVKELVALLETVRESREGGVREDWDRLCVPFLDELNYTKCRQHSQVLMEILATGHRHIIFLSQREPFFGFSTLEHHGDNQMGRSLERVRERLYAEGEQAPPYPAWKVQELERIRNRQVRM